MVNFKQKNPYQMQQITPEKAIYELKITYMIILKTSRYKL